MYKRNKEAVFLFLAVIERQGGCERGMNTAERMCSNFPIKGHWKRPHAEWLADATEPDSLISCHVVHRLPAFLKLHLSSGRGPIVRLGLIKNCNLGTSFQDGGCEKLEKATSFPYSDIIAARKKTTHMSSKYSQTESLKKYQPCSTLPAGQKSGLKSVFCLAVSTSVYSVEF